MCTVLLVLVSSAGQVSHWTDIYYLLVMRRNQSTSWKEVNSGVGTINQPADRSNLNSLTSVTLSLCHCHRCKISFFLGRITARTKVASCINSERDLMCVVSSSRLSPLRPLDQRQIRRELMTTSLYCCCTLCEILYESRTRSVGERRELSGGGCRVEGRLCVNLLLGAALSI